MKQKLLTIYMDSRIYSKGTCLVEVPSEKHGFVEEHLKSYLEDGWHITSITGIGGAHQRLSRGWFAVVLQK